MTSDEDLKMEHILLTAISNDSQKAFIKIFRRYYTDMVMFASIFLDDKADCEDVVQNVFTRLWSERHNRNIKVSLKSFLMTSVKNQCLDEMRHRKVKQNYHQQLSPSPLDITPENYYLFSELSERLESAMREMPDVDREALQLSRIEKLKYAQIALQQGVSVRTIEVRVARALKFLSSRLGDFIPMIVLILSMLFKAFGPCNS